MKRLTCATFFLAALLCLASASGQGNAAVTWRAIYQGQLGDNAVTLDLALAADGFAFARLTQVGSGTQLDGVGNHDPETGSVTLEFHAALYRFAPSVALDHAALGGLYSDADTGGSGTVVATLEGVRSLDWSDDGNTLSVELTFAAERASSGVLERTAQYAYGSLTEGRIALSYAYPRFVAGPAALNGLLEREAAERMADWAQEGRNLLYNAGGIGWAWTHSESTDLVGAAEGYRSLVTSFYYYTGGAHPNSHKSSLLVRLGGAGLEVIALEELFAHGSDWLAAVSAAVLSELSAQGAEAVVRGDVTELTALDLTTFTLEPGGLSFHFDPYAVGPYVQGDFVVTLPYADLAALAAPGGAIEAFASAYR
ncbi:MAG: DUF3298 domain-containing protein [Trueperaceae bacterium]